MGLPAMFRHGLQQALADSGVSRVRRADPHELPTTIAPDRTSVVVVPGELADHVRAALPPDHPHERVVIVHVVRDLEQASFVSAVRAGAGGVLDAAAELETAVEVIQAAAAGRVTVPADLVYSAGGAPADAPPTLGPQERRWLRALSHGGTVASLARSAAYSEREMYRQLSAMYTRMGASSRTDALMRAERWGLLDD